MIDYDGLSPGQVLADASVAEFIKSLGLGIAEAQRALDENSVQQIAEFVEPREGLAGKTLLDLGLSPAFYHYQHADISCSLQLSLRVEKDFSLGLNLNGSYSNTTSDSGSSSETSSSNESGLSTRTEARQASVEIESASVGALTIGSQNFALNGASPRERIANLRDAITGDANTDVTRVLSQLEATPLSITTDATATEVRTSANTVAFLGGGFDRGIIRVAENADTDFTLDTDPATSAATTAKADIASYATHVADTIRGQNYQTRVIAPDEPLASAQFDTGSSDIRAADAVNIGRLADTIKTLNLSVVIEGFADRQQYANSSPGPDGRTPNQVLGDNRANEVKQVLMAHGVPENSITVTPSRGDGAAASAGDPVGRDNQAFRKVDIKTSGRNDYWIFVDAKDGGPNLEGVTPDKRSDNSGNGFIYLWQPTPLDLSGKKVTIDGTDFPFDGAAVAGFAADAAEAYAKNLADDINANGAANLQASAVANIVTVSRNGDKFKLTLLTASNRQISLSSSSGVTVTEQFSRSSTSSLTQQNSGNKTVAVGASLDVRYSRQFEMNVTGNSSISARLVSIPAPPAFLETIKTFLTDAGEG